MKTDETAIFSGVAIMSVATGYPILSWKESLNLLSYMFGVDEMSQCEAVGFIEIAQKYLVKLLRESGFSDYDRFAKKMNDAASAARGTRWSELMNGGFVQMVQSIEFNFFDVKIPRCCCEKPRLSVDDGNEDGGCEETAHLDDAGRGCWHDRDRGDGYVVCGAANGNSSQLYRAALSLHGAQQG